MGLATALFVVIFYLIAPAKFQALDNQLRDYLFLLRGVATPSPDIVIIDIDEKSLQDLGQWPWKRKIFAQVLQNLTDAGAGVIGLDIVFAEEDNSNPTKVLRELGMSTKGVDDYDQILAQTVAATPTILGYVFKMEDDSIQSDEVPIIPSIFIERNKPKQEFLATPFRSVLNIPLLQKSAYSSGFFNTIPDDDSGIIRSVPLVMKYRDIVYPSLSMEMIRIMTQSNKVYVNYDQDIGVQSIQSGDLTIPTDRHGRLLVNYKGPSFTYPYISASDIYQGAFKPEVVAGKFVLIGTSAAGLLDLRATPFDNVYPGVEIHATVIDNVLSHELISKPSWVLAADILIIFVVGISLALLLGFRSVFFTVLFFGIHLVGQLSFHYYMLFVQGIAFNLLFDMVILSSLIFIIAMTLDYFLETRQNNLIKSKFASKVSKDVMEDILKHPESSSWEGEERELTVFFSDVRGFTNISEAVGDVKLLITLMNDIMEPMTEIIIDEKGTVDKFIGDAIMAYWNAPHDVKDHAERAVIASLKQLHSLKELNVHVRQDPRFVNVVKMADENHIPIIDIGIGLNTGVAIVGEMGSKGRSDYTVIGDTINLGSRLESLCKYYNSKLNISNFTKEQLTGDYIYRYLDLVTVKGKSEPVEIWQIHDEANREGETLCGSNVIRLREELKLYHEAIDFYKNGDFSEAFDIFRELNKWPDKSNVRIYDIYIDRCENYLADPPEDFNGVYVHTTKG